jgi:hypothetical protein
MTLASIVAWLLKKSFEMDMEETTANDSPLQALTHVAALTTGCPNLLRVKNRKENTAERAEHFTWQVVQ